MTPNCRTGENGLSEVVGFVLLLGVLVLVFSLYLTYGIPAQGRENEVGHMNDVKDEFMSYKIGVDSLWINHQANTAMGTAMKLGTTGKTTQGSNSFIPILQPVGSSGTIAINQRTPSPENLKITSQSLIVNETDMTIIEIHEAQDSLINSTPQHLYLNITGITSSHLNRNTVFGTQLQGVDSVGKTWSSSVNLTPRISYYQTYTLSGVSPTYTLIPQDVYNYSSSDLTLTVNKSGSLSLQDYILYKNVTSGDYTVDLMDDAYGLKSFISSSVFPITISLIKYQDPMAPVISTKGVTMFAYNATSLTYSVPLGSLEYRANNNYWIPQTYYYQMGGVFLTQNDGVTCKLPPSISFPNGSLDVINVSIIAIAYDTSRTDGIGGSSPVQIKTVMNPDSGDLPYAPIYPNTWNMSINITTPDNNEKTRDMWENFFKESAQQAGWPESYYDANCAHPPGYYDCYITIAGPDTDPDVADIDLSVKTVNLTANVQNIGGI